MAAAKRTPMMKLWPVPVFLFLMPLHIFSQETSSIDYETARLSRIVGAVRITENISIDGHLDEPAWERAAPASDFTQWQPAPGQPSGERTEVRFLYDDDNLYVGFICFDSDAAKMVVNDLREDFGVNDTDSVSFIIDSLHDRRSGFSLRANPAGARSDGQISNDGTTNNDWDGVWNVKTSINDEGWIAEFVIPFKTLRFSRDPSQEWGLNIARRVLRLNEVSYWSPVPVRYRGTNVSLAGTLRGLENIRQGRNLKVKPFVTAGITEVRDSSTEQDYDGGLDAKYSLTPSLTLDATYRTDFAQVEVDQQQVNLTRFNIFFPEKRDFFLENSGTFTFGGEGGGGGGGANLVPFFSRRIGLSASGIPIPIVGGGRVSGQVGRYDVGFLLMKTADQGSTPSNNYLVGRIKRQLLTNSFVGVLVTHRDSTLEGDTNRVYGGDAHFQFYRRLNIDSHVLMSDTPGRSGRNHARRLQTSWVDDEMSMSVEYATIEANFNPEVGFVRRGDLTQYSGEFSWNPLMGGSNRIRNLTFGTSVDYSSGATSGKVETRNQRATMGVLFQSTSAINFNIDETFDRLTGEDSILGVPISAGDYRYRSYSASANSNRSEKISGNAGVNWGEFWDGHRKSFSGGLSLKPNYHWNVTFNYSHNRVKLSKGSATTDLLGMRLLYGFTPQAFINAFVQYNAANHRVSSNIRFNFTHHPLSDLFLVYNDIRDTDNGQLVERAFIVKLTNLFNF